MKRRKIGVRVVSMLLMVAMLFSLVPAGLAAQAHERILPGEATKILPIAIPSQVSFEDAVKIAEEFLIKNPDGTLTLNMPRRTIRTIGKEIYSNLQNAITYTNTMISMGYLDFDKNFNANITEKYQRMVTAKISAVNIDTQLKFNEQFKSIDVFSAQNTTITNCTCFRGINKVRWYWWGHRVWVCATNVTKMLGGMTLAGIGTGLFIPVAGKFIAAAIGASAAIILIISAPGRGIIMRFHGFGRHVILTSIKSQ